MNGTRTGVFRGLAPTEKAVSLPTCTVLPFDDDDDDAIPEIWYYANLHTLLVATAWPSS